jgi:uncharacterized RDD family membrane protein YckC
MTQSPDHPQEQGFQGAASTPPNNPYPSAPPISEAYGAQTQGELAGRGKRFLAALIDGIILNIIAAAITIPALGTSGFSGSTGTRLGANAITAVLSILYFGLQHGKWGQSIGKRALGTRVVRAADAGPIDMGTAFGRVLFTYVISAITLGIFSLIDALWIFGNDRKQCLHDKVVKTVVVNADGPDPYASV